MKKFIKPVIETLLQQDKWPAVSIYLPVSPIGDQQDSLRYKNSLAEVESALIQGGIRAPEARELLEKEYQLVKEVNYWKNLGANGLAVFLSKQDAFHYPLPAAFEEQVIVGHRYHIRPLLPLLSGGIYLVLALSRNKVRLFRGGWCEFAEIDPPEDMPRSMAEALKFDDPEKQLQFHTKTGSTQGRRDAMFHGQGAGSNDQNDNLERYLQAVDRALFPLLEDPEVPVLLAGTKELQAVYRKASKCHTLLEYGLDGNVSEMPPEELHPKVWDIARETFAEKELNAVRKFQNSLGGERAVDELQSVLTAAFDGRVEALFVAENEHLFGSFDPDKRLALIQQQNDLRSVDLLDEAVHWTLYNKGSVYLKKPAAMPIDRSLCAQLRY